MQTIVLIILVAIVIIISVIIAYLIKDYLQYKTQVNTQFSVTQSQVNSEQKDRIASLKYVVDQVNTVNDDISSTLNNETDNQTQFISDLDKSQGNFLNGLNAAFSFNDNSGTTVPIINLQESVNPNMQLLNNVTATMGLTAKDLQPNGNTVKLCSKTDPSKCIQFPDRNGNTYLTDMGNGGIILDGQKGTTINNGMNLNGGLNMNASAGTPSGSINPSGPNQMVLQSAKVGVGNFGTTAPLATLHVSSQNSTDNILQLSGNTPTNNVITVSPNGTITIFSGNAQIGTIEPDPRNNGLKIKTHTLTIDGDLNVPNGLITGRINNP